MQNYATINGTLSIPKQSFTCELDDGDFKVEQNLIAC